MYECIQREMETLQQEGFECVLMGDLNGHIGAGPDGM